MHAFQIFKDSLDTPKATCAKAGDFERSLIRVWHGGFYRSWAVFGASDQAEQAGEAQATCTGEVREYFLAHENESGVA